MSEPGPGSSSLSPQMQNADRISTLPDHLLCEILSFLTIKEAATSSILSARWRHIFTSIPNIILKFTLPEEIEQYHSHVSKFISFGNRLFRLRNGALITKFKIRFPPYGHYPDLSNEIKPAIESWISVAVSCKVQELSIPWASLFMEHTIQSTIFTCKTLVSLRLGHLEKVQLKEICLPRLKVLRMEVSSLEEDLLPRLIQGCPLLEKLDLSINRGRGASKELSGSGIFRCERLVALRVCLRVSPLVFPNSVCLPNLKALYIKAFHVSLDSKGDNAIQCFIYHCPVLEEFHLIDLYFPNNQSGTVRIQSSSLKFLCLQSIRGRGQHIVVIESTSLKCLVYFGKFRDKDRLIVNAPNLRHFDYIGELESVLFPLGPRFPFTAIISVEKSVKYRAECEFSLLARQAFELVTDLQAAKSLWLSDITLMGLYHCQNPLPSFNNLTSLKLFIREYHFTGVNPKHWWEMFQKLSARAPNLEVLVMENVFWDTWIPDEEFDSFERFLHVNLPVHFIERLKEIRMDAFKPHENDLLAFEYILENGKALKRFTVGASPFKLNSIPEYCSRVLSLKKCSKDCQIVFQSKLFTSVFVHNRLESIGVKTFFTCG